MNKKIIANIIGILMIVTLVSAGIIEEILEKPQTEFTTDQYEFARTYKVMITGDELLWVDSVQINDGEVKIIPKSEVDRTYQKCIKDGLGKAGEYICLEYQEAIHPIPSTMPVTKDENTYVKTISPTLSAESNTEFIYDIKEDEHILKIGDHSIFIIEDIITDATLINVTNELNNTHLIPSNLDPYDNLVGYWTMDLGGNIIYDFTSNNNDGSIEGDPEFITGLYDDGMEFDMVGDYIDTGEPMDFSGDSSKFSMTCWIKTTHNEDNYFIGTHRDTGVYARIEDTYFVNDYVLMIKADDGSNDEWTGGTTTINDGEWHFIVLTLDSDTNEFLGYVDGIKEITLSTGSVGDMTDNFWFGGIASPPKEFYNGSIDDVMLFDKALSQAEITAIYNNQSNRYFGSGIHSIAYDFEGSVEGTLQIESDYEADVGSQLNLTLFYNNGSMQNAGTQVYDGDNQFSTSGLVTDIILNYSFYAGSNAGDYDFYSPLLLGESDITITTKTNCAYTGSGNWKNDQYCEYSDLNTNVDGNISILDGGTMKCIVAQCNLNMTSSNQWMIYENVADTENKLIGNWTFNAI